MAPTTLANGMTITTNGGSGSGSGNVLDGTGRDTYGEASFTMPNYEPLQGGTEYSSWAALHAAITGMGDLGGQIFKFTGSDISSSSYVFTGASNFHIDGMQSSLLDGTATAGETGGGSQRNTGAFFKCLMEDCHDFTIRGLTIRGMQNSGIELGQGNSTAAGRAGCTNALIEHNIASGIGAVAYRATNLSDNCRFYYNEAFDIGAHDTSGNWHNGRGEGFYMGFGNNSSHYATNMEIVGNYVHDNFGEAVDMKRHSSGLLIEHNLFRNANVGSQGAVVISLNETNANSDTIIRNNIIDGVTTRHSSVTNNACGIVVAAGDVEIDGNIIMNTDGHSVDVYANSVTSNDSLNIIRNILYNQGAALPVRENVGTSSGSTASNPLSITRLNNIVGSGPSANESLISAEPLLSGPFNVPSDFAIN